MRRNLISVKANIENLLKIKTKMNKLFAIALSLFVGIAAISCNESSSSSNSTKLENQLDSVSFSLGVSIGSNFERSGLEGINFEAFKSGIEKAMAKDSALAIDLQAANSLLQAYFKNLQEEKAKKNKEEGDKFLEENAKKDGITVTESGLQYEVIKEGTGEKPTLEDRVTVHYHGTLIDGTVFDSSVEKGQPASFGVGQVIPGWTEALQLMPVGSKWKVYVPSDLAYGPRGAGGLIQPNSALIFEVELISIDKPAEETKEEGK